MISCSKPVQTGVESQLRQLTALLFHQSHTIPKPQTTKYT